MFKNKPDKFVFLQIPTIMMSLMIAIMILCLGIWLGATLPTLQNLLAPSAGGNTNPHLGTNGKETAVDALGTDNATALATPDMAPITRHLPQELATALDDLWYTLADQSLQMPDVADAKQSLMKALVASIGDPYSVWLSKEEDTQLENRLDGEYVGMGFDTAKENGDFFIANILENSVASKADLKIGDKIISLNGIAINGSSELYQTAKSLSKDAFELVVARETQTIKITLKPFPYKEPALTHRPLSDDLYLVDINTFSEETRVLFDQAVSAIKSGGYQGVIFDVRFNFGGYMPICYDMISSLIKPDTIAYEEHSSDVAPISRTREQVLNLPYVVLINGETYSAAELFADALKTHGKSPLIGEKTYGKGTMQGLFTGEEGTLKLSTAYFSATQGARFSGIGIEPTQKVVQIYANYREDLPLSAAIKSSFKFLSP